MTSVDIDSPANPRIRAAIALRERRARVDGGRTLVDGARECRRALQAQVEVVDAFVCRELIASEDAHAALSLLEASDAPVTSVSRRAFERLAFGDRLDGVVLLVATPSTDLDAVRLPDDALVVVTEDVEKPGNLGAILRSADGAAADAVIAVGGTDLFNPNVIRASIGTIFSMAVAGASADDTLTWLRERRLRIIAARTDGQRWHTDADLTGPIAIVLGSESSGLSTAWSGSDVETVRLPMLGRADSLNVAATAAVLLYEARRQRGLPAAQSR
jgi:TrmH family RNA methyltransferase